MPGTASRSGSDIFASFAASLRTAGAGTSPSKAPAFATLRGRRIALFAAHASASAAAVPEVAITSGTRLA